MKRPRQLLITLLSSLIIISCVPASCKLSEILPGIFDKEINNTESSDAIQEESQDSLSEYISTTGSASPGEETRIELEDGAAIVIPVDSINDEVEVLIERNPDKTETLPPLDKDVIQVSDFYNYEIEGGELVGGVDLVFPFDESQIAGEDGLLTVAIPTEDGWEYIPVANEGGKATYFTTDPGDPIIAWHFFPNDDAEDYRQMMEEELTVCDPYIQLDVTPSSGEAGTEIEVSGQVLPLRGGVPGWQKRWGYLLNIKPASNIPVQLSFGSSYKNAKYGEQNLKTDENGFFSTTYTVGTVDNGVHIKASAQCDKWFGKMPVPSEGTQYFRLGQPEEEPSEEAAEEVAPTPEPEETIPEGAMELPDFVGQPLEDAVAWLKDNGFRYSWVDGASSYELGYVYEQQPSAGEMKIPNRTTVVLKRTSEKQEDPYGCDSPELTPQERINCGEVTYSIDSRVVSGSNCYVGNNKKTDRVEPVSYTHLRAHET